MGKIMRASAWFAGLCASLVAASALAGEGVEIPVHAHAAFARSEPAETAWLAPALSHEIPVVHRAAVFPNELMLTQPACPREEACREGFDGGRLLYRGARRYMPAFEGLAAEGISIRRDRVVLRYSFR
jgi:hypothetical protein